MQRTKAIFRKWTERLEHEPELFGLRLFLPSGGLIWRNAAAREFYARQGFFGSPTIPWRGVKKWLPPAELKQLNFTYDECFKTGLTLELVVAARVTGHPVSKTKTRLRAVYGTPKKGVILTHLQPLLF